MNTAIIDIETPLIPKKGLDYIDKIFCIGIKSDDNPVKCFTYITHKDSDGDYKEIIKYINSHKKVVFHNGINFDVPVIENILGDITIPIEDTLILAQLTYSKPELKDIDKNIEDMPKDLISKYSLKAFGYRLNFNKIQFEQFDELDSEMITYCKQDVELTYRLYNKLMSDPKLPSRNIIEFEYQIAKIIYLQKKYGFYYNKEEARKLLTTLKYELISLDHKLKKHFKPKFLPKGKPVEVLKPIIRNYYAETKFYKDKFKTPYRRINQLKKFKNGRIKFPSKTSLKWFTYPTRIVKINKCGIHQPIVYTNINLGSREHIKYWLKMDRNFEFKTFTEKGSLKVDKEELTQLGELGTDLLNYLKKVKDISEIVGVLEEFNDDTNSIHGSVSTLGAVTHRCTHSKPNIAQTNTDKRFRDLYQVPNGYTLVGADLANIEVRMLAHYLYPYDNGKYIKAVLSKDMHWYHSKLAGFWDKDDRDWDPINYTEEMDEARKLSKGFFFSWLYGAGDTVRGLSLWREGCLPSYTQEEYSKAKYSVETRLKKINDLYYFPLKKDQYILYDESLILKTIYGKRISETFLDRVEGIKDLIQDCQIQSKKNNTVKAIDGRNLYSRSPHSALNLLLQGSAGIVAKQWGINYNYKAMVEKRYVFGKDYWQSVYMHDEYQVTTKTNLVSSMKEILESSARKVTKDFNINIPIEASASSGPSWKYTH